MSSDRFTKHEILQWKKRVAAPEPDSSFRCDIIDLEMGRCHYVVHDIDAPPGGFYCGAPSETHQGTWCLYHAGRVYQGREFFTAPELLQEAA